jgi:DNA-directed RNA polymerase subunit omega
MARITSETATLRVGSKYDLILIAARRARELRHGHAPLVAADGDNEVVIALREIEQGLVGRDYLLKQPDFRNDRKKSQR